MSSDSRCRFLGCDQDAERTIEFLAPAGFVAYPYCDEHAERLLSDRAFGAREVSHVAPR